MESEARGGCIPVGTGGAEGKLSPRIISQSPPTVMLHPYLVAQHNLALLGSLGHLVAQVPQVTHLDLVGHMILLHLLCLDKYKVHGFFFTGLHLRFCIVQTQKASQQNGHWDRKVQNCFCWEFSSPLIHPVTTAAAQRHDLEQQLLIRFSILSGDLV